MGAGVSSPTVREGSRHILVVQALPYGRATDMTTLSRWFDRMAVFLRSKPDPYGSHISFETRFLGTLASGRRVIATDTPARGQRSQAGVFLKSKPDLCRITDQSETRIVLRKLRRIWSAGTCHRFSFARIVRYERKAVTSPRTPNLTASVTRSDARVSKEPDVYS